MDPHKAKISPFETMQENDIKRFLKSQGVPTWQSWIPALSGKGWWRKSGCPQAHQSMNL